MYLTISHPISKLFSELYSNPELRSELVLKAMERMVGCCSEPGAEAGGNHTWKRLYLTERYADCLYHAKYVGTRHALREKLLEEQAEFYGSARRNVLWTLTNVADDHLEKNQPMMAEAAYMQSLRLANTSLEGFDRGKIQFAAFEGLARTALLRAENERRGARVRFQGSATNGREKEALKFLEQAEETAQTWFEASSRRTAKVRQQREDLTKEINEMDRTALEL